MITLEIGNQEFYNSETKEFEYTEGTTIRFEYSLKAMYDWEAKWRKPFLKGDRTEEELLDFYMTMALDPIQLDHLTTDVQRALANYMQDTPTGTKFSSSTINSGSKAKSKIYSAEEIYALMASAGVDIIFENRHINRLLIVLRIIGEYNSPPKKMSKDEVMKQNRSLNEQRKAELKTKG